MSSKLHIALALIPLLGTAGLQSCNISSVAAGKNAAEVASPSSPGSDTGGGASLTAALTQNQVRLMNGTTKVCGNGIDQLSRISAADASDYKGQVDAILAGKSSECRTTFEEAVAASAPLVSASTSAPTPSLMDWVIPSAYANDGLSAPRNGLKPDTVFVVMLNACVNAHIAWDKCLALAGNFKSEILDKAGAQ